MNRLIAVIAFIGFADVAALAQQATVVPPPACALAGCTMTGQLALGLGSLGSPSIVIESGTTAGWYSKTAGNLDAAANGAFIFRISNGAGVTAESGSPFNWSNTGGDPSATKDTGLSRVSAGIVGVGNGTNGSVAGLLETEAIISAGGHPTGTTGTCTASSFVGGFTAGTFSSATCAGGTYILSGLPTAPNGYACIAQDQTTPADTVKQTANGTSSVTFTATTVSSDVVAFHCMAF
jgi:hypothetical protein